MKTYCVKQTLNSHHRWLFAVMAAMAIGVAGCQEDQRTHQDQKQQAQTHWNQVRAKIKRQLAQQQYQSGELEAAISTIRESLGLDPSCVESYVLLGRTLLEKGDLAQAKQTLQAAEALGLSSAELSYAQGMVTERTGELAAAVEHYQQAHRLNPADQDFVVAQAECLVAAGRPEEARQLVEQSLAEFDRDGTLDVLLAEICLVIGDREAAIVAFRRALPITNDDPLIAETFGALLVETNRFAEAVRVLQPVVDRSDYEPSGMITRALAQSYLELYRADKAHQLLQDWLTDHPDDLTAWLLQAQSALMRQDVVVARRCLQVIRRLAPGHPQTQLLTGLVCWRQGDFQSAQQALEQFLARTPDDALAHCLLGQVLADGDRLQAARQHWQRALQINPDLRWARSRLADSSSW